MKTYNNKLRNYNWDNYILNFKKTNTLNEKLTYPSLLSKSLLSGDKLFWDKYYKLNFNSFIKILIKTLIFIFPKLIFNYIRIFILKRLSNIKKRKIAFIFSRSAGIKNFNNFKTSSSSYKRVVN